MKKIKKAKVILLCLIVVLSLLPVTAFAEEQTVTIDNIQYTLNSVNLTAEATKGSPTDGKIVIPDEISADGVTYKVTSVAAYAFEMKTYSEIIIGANMEEIKKEAFGTSFDVVTRIEFQGANCQKIDSMAFDWMSFSTDFQLVVHGEEGCMDSVLSGVTDLAEHEIIYIVPGADEPGEILQKQINEAPDGEEMVIEITDDIGLTKTITIPGGKNIVLTDNNTPHTISPLAGKNVEELFKVANGGSLTFDGDLTFAGGISESEFTGNIVNVCGNFYLKQAVLTGGTITGRGSAAVLVDKDGAVFEMSGGTIENFSLKKGPLTAPVVVGTKAVFNMSGGKIRQNINTSEFYSSGGVLVYTWNGDPTAKMTMSDDAEISGNTSYAGGGGVYMIGNADFVMDGGAISGNLTYGQHGGGVCVAGANKGANPDKDVCRFTMQGGTISNNRSAQTGGGIYVNSEYVTLKAGHIENNTAGSMGGGVYVSQTPYTLHVYDALITENTATYMGGGLWFCPSGSAKAAVTNGAAIYDNTAASKEGTLCAGDDFVALGKRTGKTTLSERILGGGAVEWYVDGAVKNYSTPGVPDWMQTGDVDPSVARWDPENPGERVYMVDSNETCSLKAVVSDAAKELAESNAKLIIKGNTAERGGGIGSNGTVIIGTWGEEYELNVEKIWSDDTPDEKKTELTVYLKIGDYQLDAVKLNRENNWSAKFVQLPNPEGLNAEYAVIESPVPENFNPVYHEAKIEENVISITIENQYIKTGNLQISKTVSGSAANANQDFSFTVTLDDESINGTYGDLTFKNGVAVFTLKANESKTAAGLPAGTAYTAEESGNSGYTVTVNGKNKITATGTIKADATVTETFNNHKSGGETPDPSKPSDKSADKVPQTGDNGNVGLWIAIVCLSLTAMIITFFAKKHRSIRR